MNKDKSKIHSVCPKCKRVLPASEIEISGSLFLEVECPEHGPHRSLYKRDAAFYKQVSSIVRSDIALDGRAPANMIHIKDAKIIGIDLTDCCNLSCPVCFASTNQSAEPPLTNVEIIEKLKALSPKALEITLLGGEPTLREDLPDLIRAIVKMGFKLKLITNGLRFENPDYAAELKNAGLKWIIYQFDGFEPQIYVKLRGQDLLERKLRILQTMSALDFNICLAVMVVSGVNDHQIGELIRFGFRQPGVRHIALLPASSLGRDNIGLPDSHMHADELMEIIDRQTDGRIKRSDWLDTMRWMDRIYRLTGHIDFKQRVCFFSMPLIGDKDDFTPAAQLIRPSRFLRNMTYLPAAAYVAKNLFSIDKHSMPDNLLYLSIEKMHCTSGLHLEDAAQCNTLYMTRGGYIPTCVYNALYREAPSPCAFF
jgi:uncharacterized radical SAM superfamily Fe-S cluster-containing enzyme